MKGQNRLSNVAREYHAEFKRIFDTMVCEMTESEPCDSISENFIALMIPQNQAAIDMSRNILKYTTNLKLQDIAEQIIVEKTKNIKNMREIKKCCSNRINQRKDIYSHRSCMNRTMKVMFAAMENAPVTNCINCDFIRQMIPLLRGAVEMSTLTQQCEICPELKPVLREIIECNRCVITQLQNLARCLKC